MLCNNGGVDEETGKQETWIRNNDEEMQKYLNEVASNITAMQASKVDWQQWSRAQMKRKSVPALLCEIAEIIEGCHWLTENGLDAGDMADDPEGTVWAHISKTLLLQWRDTLIQCEERTRIL